MKKLILLAAAAIGLSLFAMNGTAEANHRGLYRGGFYGAASPFGYRGISRSRGPYMMGRGHYHPRYDRFRGGFDRGFHRRAPRFFFGTPGFGIMIR